MILRFRYDLKAAESRQFEEVYEPELQLEDADKDYILRKGMAVWLIANGMLAGETYGIFVRDDQERIEDTIGRDNDIYCYSTTILPPFQGKGLAKLLKAHWLGYIWGQYPGVTIVGHATSPTMVQINRDFGAVFLTSHEGWYGTGRVAHFYEVKP